MYFKCYLHENIHSILGETNADKLRMNQDIHKQHTFIITPHFLYFISHSSISCICMLDMKL